MLKRWCTLRFASSTLTLTLVAAVVSLAVVSVATAGSGLTVIPTSVQFAPTLVGSYDYQKVEIANAGPDPEYISFATTSSRPPFFPTYGGTCNGSVDGSGKNYYIPAGSSCTFEWGFGPVGTGPQTGTGTIHFDSGATLTVTLAGIGTIPRAFLPIIYRGATP